jgi:hypothetical protein
MPFAATMARASRRIAVVRGSSERPARCASIVSGATFSPAEIAAWAEAQ